MLGPDVVDETTEKIKIVRENMKKAQDRQKKYADQNRREVIFQVCDWVYLKVAAQKGRDRFGKVEKLATRYIGPYRVMQRVGEVAYQLELPSDMALHPVFHVSMLRRHIRDPTEVEPQRVENLRSNLTYPEGPLRIGERRIRKLKNREIPQVQVFWGKQRRVIVTWEDEERFRATHPELFLEDDEDQMGGASNH